MSEEATAQRLQTGAFVLAASAVAGPAVAALLVQAVLFQLNPRGLHLGVGTAYEIEIWATFLVAMVAVAIAIARVFSLLARRAGRGATRYPMLVVQLQIGFAVAAIGLILLTPGLTDL